MSTADSHEVIHVPTGWIIAAGLTLSQANALRHALARRHDGSALVEQAAAGDPEALQSLRSVVENIASAALRQSAINAAETGAAMPEPGKVISAKETIRRLRVALSASSELPWVFDLVRSVIVVRPPNGRAAHLDEDRRALAKAFRFQPQEAEVLIPPEGRLAFIARAEAEAIKAMRQAGTKTAGGGSRVKPANTSSPLGLLLARILGDAHEPLNFAEIVAKTRRSRRSETPAEILRTLEAMCEEGYANELSGHVTTFVTGRGGR